MTAGPGHHDDGEPMDDLAQIMADDALLDALARGDDAPPGDELAALLAAWRDDIGQDVGGEQEHRAAVIPLLPATVQAARQRVRWRRRLVAAAVAVIASGGLAYGVDHAGPGNPLFVATRVVFPDTADVRLAQRAVDDAYAAARAGRCAEAWPLTFEAEDRIARVGDQSTAEHLQQQIDELRQWPGMVEALRRKMAADAESEGRKPEVGGGGVSGGTRVVPPATAAPGGSVSPTPAVRPSTRPGGPTPTQVPRPGDVVKESPAPPALPSPSPSSGGGLVGDLLDGLLCGLLPCESGQGSSSTGPTSTP